MNQGGRYLNERRWGKQLRGGGQRSRGEDTSEDGHCPLETAPQVGETLDARAVLKVVHLNEAATSSLGWIFKEDSG